MRRLIAILACLLTLSWFSINGSPLASADVQCKRQDPLTGTCLIEVKSGGKTMPKSGISGGSKQRALKPVARTAECLHDGVEVACRLEGGVWSNTRSCYLKPLTNQPPVSDPLWQGHTTGKIYNCFLPEDGDPYPIWLAAAPGAPAPPDPELLARRAVAAMGLSAVSIGIVPEDRPGRVGVIGLPTWMWVEDPGPVSWGPIARTASAGGFSVTATGRVDRVVWAMGDGSTAVCRKPGTPYADSFGKRSSPDCGHTYTRQGTYTVRATSYWTVTWAGIGQTGSIPLDFTASTVITMGEVQVLTQ